MFLRDDGNARSTQSHNSRKMIGSKGLFSCLLAIVGLAAVLAVAAPASAMSVNQWSGRPGVFVSNDPFSFHLCESIYLDQYYQAKLSTGTMTIGPSPAYAPSNQTIARNTYFQYSVDDGQTWSFWKWVYGGAGTPGAGGLTFYSTNVPLAKGYSYRVYDMFRFYSNGVQVGEIWYQYASTDYQIFAASNAIWGSNTARITNTKWSPGCTVS